MNIKLGIIATAGAASLALAACATETRTEREFGDSVRAVATGQIHDMGAAQYPDKNAVTGGPGDRFENVIKAHKEAAAQTSGSQNSGSAGTTILIGQ